MRRRRVIILGATGSIGTQTVGVIEHLNALALRGAWPCAFDVVAMVAGRNGASLESLARRTNCPRTLLAEDAGHDAARLVRDTPCDLVVSAIVGLAGLEPTLAALDLGLDVALANKETLVAAGPQMMARARATGARLLPIDSEHSGVWQVLLGAGGEAAPPGLTPPPGARITLTASGGPCLHTARADLERVTPETALRHPTWRMGPKNTVDSATLMNKALELIEARWLFDVAPGDLSVVIHPQSIVHAMVTLADGSVLAQLSRPSMAYPIQFALTFPGRAPEPPRVTGADGTPDAGAPSGRAAWGTLEFVEPDPERFGALALAARVMETGGTAGAVLSAANEVAVQAFLDRRLGFTQITTLCARALDALARPGEPDLGEVREADARARRFALGALCPA
ncbi:MAG: 1-deoxy-D-xylulose-5-phosphate reductoisomerase [Phycisphaerales bacterium]|nr:1-deoxy-D-xylulose-5-phosphate reductoisomerase [Phycisphaerales bacterium]